MDRHHRARVILRGVSVFVFATSSAFLSSAVGASVESADAVGIHRPAVITSTVLPDATVDTPYAALLSQTGALGQITWVVRQNESLPRGLHLASKSGRITGIPKAAGTSTVDVVVHGRDHRAVGRATLTITVNAAPVPSASSATLPSAVVGAPYETAIAISGGTAPYEISLSSGELPRGLRLGNRTPSIRGVPRAQGTYTFTISIVDRWHASASSTFTVAVAGNARPIIATTALPVGTVGVSYNATLTAQGGCAPFAWEIPRRELPAGLSLNAATGVLSGTPRRSVGAQTLHVRVEDANQVASVATFTVTISPAVAPVINTRELPAATVNAPFSTTLTASGGSGNYRWAVAQGTLPKGLFLDSETGVISGTPTESIVAAFTVAIRDRRDVLATQLETLTVLSQ